MSDCFFRKSFLHQAVAETDMGFCIVGVNRQSLAPMHNRFVDITLLEKCPAKVTVRLRESRVQRHGSLVVEYCFGNEPLFEQSAAEVNMGVRIVRGNR